MTAFRDLTKALYSLGLTQNATTFYLESYRLGKATIGKVAEKARMDRSSAYLACKQLREAGLIEESLSEGITTIWAKAPTAVITQLRAETRRLRAQSEKLEEQLPELLAEYSVSANKPVLQYFSGKSGFAQITEDVLEHADKEILLFSNQHEERKVFTEVDHREFIKGRLTRKIKIRVLTPDTIEARTLKQSDTRSLRETRIIPGPPAFFSETYIYDDNVAMLSFNREILGFIVRSVDFATSQRWMFEQLWKGLEPHVRDARRNESADRPRTSTRS